ncbi:putative tyrosinase-like protein tyr-3 [Bulinus truncatus]|nr:putative tyrosinase-like protein tyr-3 [Bulinus truncatus]
MTSSVSLVTLTLFSSLYFTCSKIQEIPLPDELQQCYNRVQRLSVDEFVGSIYNWFCEHTLMNAPFFTDMPPINSETAEQLIDSSGIQSSNRSNAKMKRQANNGPCVRKEYRMMTLNERRRYHNAVNTLKRDTSVAPNRHDAIGNIHTGVTNLLAHGGPGFFGWHRIYLWLYESALRQVDPSVCLPYWDSTLDNELTNPLRSSIWTEDYIGTPRGPVVNGPFAGWRIPGGGQLIRNVGVDGQLLNPDDIQSVMTRSSYAEIVTSNATNSPFNLEVIHGGPHIYVGGTMSQLSTAAYDPLFFLHHAFVDYIFESFRERLRSIGVNPETYPQVVSSYLYCVQPYEMVNPQVEVKPHIVVTTAYSGQTGSSG